MEYEILSLWKDEADKYRVNVLIAAGQSQLFKFDHYPSFEEIQIEAQKFVLNGVTDEPAD